MIRFLEELYLTDNTKNKVDKLKVDIQNRAFLFSVSIIALSTSDSDVFDIIPAINLKTRIESYENLYIIGLAEDSTSAMQLCMDMTLEYLDLSLDISMREYFKNKFTEPVDIFDNPSIDVGNGPDLVK